jgi:DNA invertase Pin-like site-specific DNA recombinase
MGKAFLRILLVFAELERDRIGESWKIATSNAIDRGIHIAKFTPVGYEKMVDKRLQPNNDARGNLRGLRDESRTREPPGDRQATLAAIAA